MFLCLSFFCGGQGVEMELRGKGEQPFQGKRSLGSTSNVRSYRLQAVGLSILCPILCMRTSLASKRSRRAVGAQTDGEVFLNSRLKSRLKLLLGWPPTY